jgi:hypothetical protein
MYTIYSQGDQEAISQFPHRIRRGEQNNSGFNSVTEMGDRSYGGIVEKVRGFVGKSGEGLENKPCIIYWAWDSVFYCIAFYVHPV